MPDNPYAVSASTGSEHLGASTGKCCPLCGLEKHMNKSKLLYETPVCKTCYYKFANRRQMAFIIDNTLFQIAIFTMAFAGISVIGAGVDLIGYAIFPIFCMKDGFAGYSFGKWLCRVRLLNINTGTPGGFYMSFLRNIPTIIPIFPLIIAYQLQKGKRWGDQWSGSKVIWLKYKDHPIFATRSQLN